MSLYRITSSPHIRSKETVSSIMWYVVLSLLPAAAAGVIFFKGNALLIILISIITAVLTEFLIQKWRKVPITIIDGSAVLTGLLLALVIPPTVPWWIAILGSFFAVAIAKHTFGGLGHNIFNPALAGRAFLVASWPVLMNIYVNVDGITGATPLTALKLAGEKTASYMQLFIGNIGGSIGETSALLLLVGVGFLFYKKIIEWRIPTFFIGSAFVFSLLFMRDPLYDILAGGIILGAFFMATDYVTSPITKTGKMIFGAGCGFLTIIIRAFGGLPEGVMYAILLMNIVVPLIDRYTKPKPFGYVKIDAKKGEADE